MAATEVLWAAADLLTDGAWVRGWGDEPRRCAYQAIADAAAARSEPALPALDRLRAHIGTEAIGEWNDQHVTALPVVEALRVA